MEGPSLVILRDQAAKFVGKTVREAKTTLVPIGDVSLAGQRLKGLATWGKHFLMIFSRCTLKVHFLMFGSCWIDQPRPRGGEKLSLVFPNGALHFYSCSIRPLSEPVAEVYDWRIDLMSDEWDQKHVLRLVESRRTAMLCDLLLDQEVFAGSGNIIKNEVLFLLSLQPETKASTLSLAERRKLVREMRAYAFRFLEWKKAFVLRRNWRIYRKRQCMACGSAVTMRKTGELDRVSFYCPKCQQLRKRLPRKK